MFIEYVFDGFICACAQWLKVARAGILKIELATGPVLPDQNQMMS